MTPILMLPTMEDHMHAMKGRTNDELRIMAERPEAERTVDIFIALHKMYIHEHQFSHSKEETEHLLSFMEWGMRGYMQRMTTQEGWNIPQILTIIRFNEWKEIKNIYQQRTIEMHTFRSRMPEQMEQFLRDKRDEQHRNNITGTQERCKHLERHLQAETLTWTKRRAKEGPQAYNDLENQVREREGDNEERRHERMLHYPHWEGTPRNREERTGNATAGAGGTRTDRDHDRPHGRVKSTSDGQHASDTKKRKRPF